jgi:hypothetical protein
MVSPRSSAARIVGKTSANRPRRARLVVLPRRTQTTAGPLLLSARMVTKSSSFVIRTAPVAAARDQMSRSPAVSSPISATWTASCPDAASCRARAGGNCASIKKRTSRRPNYRMIKMPRGIFERCGNVVFFQVGKIAENLRMRCACGQQLQNIADTNPLSANTRATTEDMRVRGDAVKMALHPSTFSWIGHRLESNRIRCWAHQGPTSLFGVSDYPFGGGGGAVK